MLMQSEVKGREMVIAVLKRTDEIKDQVMYMLYLDQSIYWLGVRKPQ